jgi:peptide/nickel transport system permease protein
MVIIGLVSWTGIARLTRAEFMRLREMEFIQAAKALGYSNKRIIFKHGLPNGLSAVFVSIAFGVASAVLTESSLSFLGIGVPDDVVTWGSMLSIGKEEFDAWWLVIFPGFAIFITITVYNLIGEALRDALDPKLKK